MNKTFVCYQKTSLPRSLLALAVEPLTNTPLRKRSASLRLQKNRPLQPENTTQNRLLTKTDLSGPAQPSPEHQRRPGAASGRYTKGLSSQTL